jgi:hypothetical protein
MRPLKVFGTLLVVGAAVGFWSKASLAGTNDLRIFPNYAVTYFSGNVSTNPDETVRAVNTGFIGDPDMPSGDICVNYYVFDAHQEMKECCSCLDTANGLLVSSVQRNLTANPLTGGAVTVGVIKVTATLPTGTPPTCDPTKLASLPTGLVLRAWSSHLNPAPSGIQVTEEELANTPLSFNEAADLAQDCAETIELGSGQGVCSCPAER